MWVLFGLLSIFLSRDSVIALIFNKFICPLVFAVLECFYLNRETDTNKQCQTARGKQKNTMKLVHNQCVVFYYYTYFTGQEKHSIVSRFLHDHQKLFAT